MSTHAHAQSDVVDHVGRLIDAISRSLKSLGERSEEYIPPGMESIADLVTDRSGLVTIRDERETTLPAAPNVDVAIENEFGEIRVETWDNPVVRVRAELYAGAETADVARQVVENIGIELDGAQPGPVSIRTVYPDTRDMTVVTEVNYHITVPRNASLRIRNAFGDTAVRQVGGSVRIDARQGGITLLDIGGPVTVRARGEFPLIAEGLRGGGDFDLTWMRAEFRKITGNLTVMSYMGSVRIEECDQASNINVRSGHGPVHFLLAEGAKPDLTASAVFGTLHSGLPLEKIVRRNLVETRIANVDARQRVGLFTVFGDVYLHTAGVASQPQPTPSGAAESFRGEIARVIPVEPGAEVTVNAIIGNIVIEGTNESSIQVTAEQFVRVDSSRQALAALEALAVEVNQTATGVEIRTSALEDLAALGSTYYRVDLTIQCPHDANLRVTAASGATTVRDLGASLNLEQTQGAILIERASGTLTLRNRRGDVFVFDSAGPLDATVQSGEIRTRALSGKQRLSNTDGRTIIDAPGGEVTASTSGGDIRINALDGIHGPYYLWVTEGNVSMVRPDWANAEFNVTVEGGNVESVVPLAGELSRRLKAFRGRLNEGTHEVTIIVKGGDVTID